MALQKVGNIRQGGNGLKKVGNIKQGNFQPAPPVQQPQKSTGLQIAQKIDSSLRNFSQATENIPKAHFADNIKNPVGRVLASIAQNTINIPSKAVGTVFGGYGEDPFSKATLKRASRAAETGLDIGSLIGGGGTVKNLATQGVKQGIKPAIIQGVKSGATQGTAYGAGYGATGAFQNDKPFIPEVLKNAAIGGLGGALIGGASPVIGAGLKKVGNMFNSPGSIGTPQVAQKGRISSLPVETSTIKTGVPKPLPEKAPNQYRESSYSPSTISKLEVQPVESKPFDFNQPSGKGQQRGFIDTIENSPNVSRDLSKRVANNEESVYKVRHQDPLVVQAQKTIFGNPNEAERIATSEISDRSTIMANELVSHYDSMAQRAKEAGDMPTFNAAMEKANDISLKSASNLTEGGRAIAAAAQINRLSPNGIMQFINHTIKKVGGKDVKFSNDDLYTITRRAEEIQGMADPKQKALATWEMLDDIYSKIPKSTQEKVSEVLNLPRAIMSSADLSAGFRQGLFVAARHPVMFAKAFGNQLKYMVSEKAFKNAQADIATSPNYHLYQKYNLPLTDISKGLDTREERFMSSYAEKIPGFGHVVKGSGRAYTGMLNKMRADLFDNFVKNGEKLGITDEKYLADASRYIGAATGRGGLGSLEKAAVALNSVFFSPRLMASRLSLINPQYYMSLHPQVRKEALQSLVSMVGTGLTVLSLGKMAGADIEPNPTSSDFGKMKFGNTRYDIWGGFQQPIKAIAQIMSGQFKSTTSGNTFSLDGEGYSPMTRMDIASRYLMSKENPVASFITGMMKGEDMVGNKFQFAPEVIDRFLPMFLQDMTDMAKENGEKGILMSLPALLGVGVQNYGGGQIPMLKETPSGAPSLKFRDNPSIGETAWNSITGKEISTIPKDQWRALSEEKQLNKKQEAEINKAKLTVKATGNPVTINDVRIYMKDGVLQTQRIRKQRGPIEQLLEEEKLKKRKPFFQ